MCFDHIHPSFSQLFPDSTPPPYHPIFCSLFKKDESNLWCPNTLECGPSLECDWLIMDSILKKKKKPDSLSKAFSARAETWCYCLFSLTGCCLTWTWAVLIEFTISTDLHVSQTSSEKFLLVVESSYHRDPQRVNVQKRDCGVLSPTWSTQSTLLSPNLGDHRCQRVERC